MTEFNNTAGRLQSVLEKLVEKSGGNKDQLAGVLGIEARDWPSILTAIADLQAEYRLLTEELERFQDNPKKYSLYKKNLPDVEKSLKSFNLMFENDQYRTQVVQSGIVALQFIAADLPQEEKASVDELATLSNMIHKLQEAIHAAKDLSPTVRRWLLDLMRVMRDGLDRYRIRGARGIKKQLHEALGNLFENHAAAKDIQETQPGVWNAITNTIDWMIRVATIREQSQPAIDWVRKALPFFGEGTGSEP